MFRKWASLPKKNNISRTHGHRAHTRTKGTARRGGVGGIGYYAALWAASLNAFPICSPQGPLQALHSARSYFVAPPFVLTPINTSKLADGCKNKKEDVFRHLLASFRLRRGRDSNPRSLAAQRFSRPPQSTTLPPLQGTKVRQRFETTK